MEKKSKLNLLFWAMAFYGLCLNLTFILALYQKLQERFLGLPGLALSQPISPWLALGYFFGMTIFLSLICRLIPVSWLRPALKITFTLLFAWAVALVFGVILPFPWPLIIALFWGLIWFFAPTLWLWNLSMICALVSIGLIFGPLFSPWTAVIILVVISIYDILAVRYGFMQWLAETLAEHEVLPVLVIPREKISDLNLSFKKANISKILKDPLVKEKFSILGGGDLALPLFLIVSVIFSYGVMSSLIVTIFSLIGLITTYYIFLFFLKEKTMPALPPIAFFSILGFLIVHFFLA